MTIAWPDFFAHKSALAFFIDADGILLDIAVRRPLKNDGLCQTLARLAAVQNQAVALMSVRPLADLEQVFPVDALYLAGGNGAQVRLGEQRIWRGEPEALPHQAGAMAFLMDQEPFRSRIPVFVSANFSSDHGFAMALGLGGFAIRVGQPPRLAGEFSLPSALAVRGWLAAIAADQDENGLRLAS